MANAPSFNYDGYQFRNVSCSEKNFKKQDGFKNSGTRSLLVPELESEYKFINGFPIKQDARIYLPDKSSIPITQESIFFTYYSKLHRAIDLDINVAKNTILTEISLKNFNSEPDGYIKISSVIKPTPINLNRVNTGESAQKIVADYIKSLYPEIEYEINKPGSNKPDVTIYYYNKKINIEVKNSANGLQSLHCIFDKSVNRSNIVNSYIETISKKYCHLMSIEHNNDYWFFDLLEYYRTSDMSIGLPGDVGVKKSGKLPKDLFTDNILMLQEFYNIIINHFRETENDYFAIYNKKHDVINCFFVGDNENILEMPVLNELSYAGISSYGGVSSGSMRIGFKCKFKDKN